MSGKPARAERSPTSLLRGTAIAYFWCSTSASSDADAIDVGSGSAGPPARRIDAGVAPPSARLAAEQGRHTYLWTRCSLTKSLAGTQTSSRTTS